MSEGHMDITSAQMDALQDTTAFKRQEYEAMRGIVGGAELDALRHLFFVLQRLDRQADGSGHMVQVSAEAWKDLVRPAIRTVEHALEKGE